MGVNDPAVPRGSARRRRRRLHRSEGHRGPPVGLSFLVLVQPHTLGFGEGLQYIRLRHTRGCGKGFAPFTQALEPLFKIPR